MEHNILYAGTTSICFSIVHSCNSYLVYRQLRLKIISHKVSWNFNLAWFWAKRRVSQHYQDFLSVDGFTTFISNQHLVRSKMSPEIISHKECSNILHILVKAHPSTWSTGPWSLTRLGIRSQDLGLPDESNHCCCFWTQACFHKEALCTTHSTNWHYSTPLNSSFCF